MIQVKNFTHYKIKDYEKDSVLRVQVLMFSDETMLFL